jgi:hypothetical protein
LGDLEEDNVISKYASNDNDGRDETVLIGRRVGCTRDILDDDPRAV